MANPIVALAALLLLAVAVVTVVLAMRHRLAFRIAMRNVRRGRTRTVLLIAGLLVGTTIVSGSLVVGDTVQQLTYHYTYLGAGYDDEAISARSTSGGATFFPYSVYSQTAALTASDRSIAEVTPEIVADASAFDRTTGIPETDLNLIGVNGNQSSALGSFVADNGTSITGPLPGHVLLDDQAAGTMNASAGDALVVYGAGGAVPLVVQAVVQENLRGAFITAGLTPGNLFVDLSTAQALEGTPGRINYIAITNTGSQSAGAADSKSVSASLNTTLAALLSTYGLSVKTPLETGLEQAATSGQSLQTLFLVLGLFSILAGAMLIIGIFVMLAEERKGEMGMLRAIGMRRRDLVYSFLFEGVAYSAGSALAGTFVGAGVGYVLIYLVGFLLQGEGIPESAILQSYTVTGQSLVVAYTVGFLLTLVTVVVACWRASRLNIVRAIRDVPEPPPPIRTYTVLAGVGAVLVLLGALLYVRSYSGTGDIAYPILGGTFGILGAGLVAARFVRNRYVFTATGLALAVWSGDEPLHVALLGTAHSGGIFLLFVVGVILVGGVLMVILSNADLLVRSLRAMTGRRGQSNPVVRIGLDYPARQPGRTAVGLTIFALVVFTMVGTAAAGSTLQGSLTATVRTETGGYTFYGQSDRPLPALWSTIAANATLAPLFVNAAPLVYGEVHVEVPGSSPNPYTDDLYAPPSNATGPASFLATNGFSFQATLPGLSPAEVFEELGSNRSVAVVDESYASLANNLAVSSTPHPKLSVGARIELTTPGGADPTNLTVIGILSESIIGGVFVAPATAAGLGISNETAYFLTVASGVSTAYAAEEAKKAFFPFGLVLFDLPQLLAQSISTTEGFIGILEVFVGLGLAVGIAAMGIFALRAVTERRREIGMLRATGFTQGMVLRALVLEYSFVTVLGIAVGVGLGMLVIYNVTISPSAASEGLQRFVAPWAIVLEVAAITYLLVLVAIAGPALRASRLPPAVAVRTTE